MGVEAAIVVAVSDAEETGVGPLSADELCAKAAISAAQLASLVEYGIIQARGSGAQGSYSSDSVDLATIAGKLMTSGVDARHLRGWRQSVEREAALFEQLVTPLLRQRNPASRRRAIETLDELSVLGGQLRGALMSSALRSFSESN